MAEYFGIVQAPYPAVNSRRVLRCMKMNISQIETSIQPDKSLNRTMETDNQSRCGDVRLFVLAAINRSMGLTHTDLLIVIVLIIFLLTLMCPFLFAAMRQRFYRSRCQGNLKQLSSAWSAYFEDHEGHFYKGINAHLDYGGWRGTIGWWPRPLNPYLNFSDPAKITEESAKTFHCPGDNPGKFDLMSPRIFERYGTSYQVNIILSGLADTFRPSIEQTAVLDQEILKCINQISTNNVDNPSRVILMGDYGWVRQSFPRPRLLIEGGRSDSTEWHERKACHNVLFLDGHCEFMRLDPGVYLNEEYTVLPYRDLYPMAYQVQSLLKDPLN